MIVIADTTPLNYLILINQINILGLLYGRVVIPMAVLEELMKPSAPPDVRTWVERPPDWLEVVVPATPHDTRLAKLDSGERDAILLAEAKRRSTHH